MEKVFERVEPKTQREVASNRIRSIYKVQKISIRHARELDYEIRQKYDHQIFENDNVYIMQTLTEKIEVIKGTDIALYFQMESHDSN